ncbi:unnamed protein product [Protopolystoma xenopodis]|uniref:Uncharacterized protein n=1 Tax=Protopolystoma xenopodis TaxID=117903 RepID=A0A448WJW6_9PLAT|nr:unnamed protein product [Protopolystoma xenopodis]
MSPPSAMTSQPHALTFQPNTSGVLGVSTASGPSNSLIVQVPSSHTSHQPTGSDTTSVQQNQQQQQLQMHLQAAVQHLVQHQQQQQHRQTSVVDQLNQTSLHSSHLQQQQQSLQQQQFLIQPQVHEAHHLQALTPSIVPGQHVHLNSSTGMLVGGIVCSANSTTVTASVSEAVAAGEVGRVSGDSYLQTTEPSHMAHSLQATDHQLQQQQITAVQIHHPGPHQHQFSQQHQSHQLPHQQQQQFLQLQQQQQQSQLLQQSVATTDSRNAQIAFTDLASILNHQQQQLQLQQFQQQQHQSHIQIQKHHSDQQQLFQQQQQQQLDIQAQQLPAQTEAQKIQLHAQTQYQQPHQSQQQRYVGFNALPQFNQQLYHQSTLQQRPPQQQPQPQLRPQLRQYYVSILIYIYNQNEIKGIK